MRWPSPPGRDRAVLDDGVVAVRPHRPDDAGPFLEAVQESLGEIGEWMEWVHPGYSLTDAVEWIESQDRLWDQGWRLGFGFVDPASGLLLGAGGLNRFDPTNRRANLGYWVRTSAVGRGVATRAVRLMSRFGFAEVGLRRVEIAAGVDNTASRRVAEKAGARFEGVARNRLLLRGESFDAAVYGLVP
ncbi:MAG TPA: GNAT family N-acetyltransferase [Acidimicrobiia bacterium]|nr:GNAT family N-acetyltransferase [Acidimicrobiia bacterium]